MSIARVFIVCFTVLLVGCGFHLRGMVAMPSWLNNVAIVAENSTSHELITLLKNQFHAYTIRLAPSVNKASYILIIESDSSQQQITSVSASTTPRQYQLIYIVRFKMVNRKGKEILPSSQVAVSRQLTVNNDRILGSDAEEATIHAEMQRDAVIQIINRLHAAAVE